MRLFAAVLGVILAGCAAGVGSTALPTHETPMARPSPASFAPTRATATTNPTPLAPPAGMPTAGPGAYVGVLDELDEALTCFGAWIREGPDVPEGGWFELVLSEPYGWTRSDGLLAIKEAGGVVVARELDWVLISGTLDPSAGSYCMAGRQLLVSQVTSYGSAGVQPPLPTLVRWLNPSGLR